MSLSDYATVPRVYSSTDRSKHLSPFEEVAGSVVTDCAGAGSDTSSLLENFQSALHGEVFGLLRQACEQEGAPRTAALEELFYS